MSFYRRYLEAQRLALESIKVTQAVGVQLNPEEGFECFCAMSKGVQESGGKQYLIGNGASAAFADHMALDWTKNGGVPTMSFASAALLTAMGNDLGFEEVFSAPLSWYAKRGDLLVTISSSGNSENILRAIDAARTLGMSVVTLSGLKPDNRSRQLGDLNFYVPAKTYGVVECAHQLLLHLWLDKFTDVSEWNSEGYQDMRCLDSVRELSVRQSGAE
ncbi:MAG: D-sedoheptulose 7-phosphate isomerase [Crocinitomicaceae bacterium]|jgi:D-sedoheptulose 7-phosphate isomerase